MTRNITITGNRITGWHTNPMGPRSASAINLRNVVGVVIENNTIGESGAKPSISTPVLLKNCTDVINRGNKSAKEDK